MLKSEIVSVLWYMGTANFVFIAVKKLKIYENVAACGRSELGVL